jgi:signal transduction histidine kinase/ABC-type multidrug transport system ATPase subunit
MSAAPTTKASGSALLEISRLCVSFGRRGVLEDVDLRIRPGELVGLAGEPGAGKTTLARCAAGVLAPSAGLIRFDGLSLPADQVAAGQRGIVMVWQDLELCDNLDVAATLLLGRESARLMRSESRLHSAAAALLDQLGIPVGDTTRLVGSLSGEQRQLLTLARAIAQDPRLLILDQPTSSLGLAATQHVETLIQSICARGTAVLLISPDGKQLFRLAHRILVLRRGRLVAELDPHRSHPDDLASLLAGQPIDSSARRQLNRLHGLADRLLSAGSSSSLSLILSTLGAALGVEYGAIHIVSERWLQCAACAGFDAERSALGSRLPVDSNGPLGQVVSTAQPILGDGAALARECGLSGCSPGSILGSWSVPVIGPTGVIAVITVFRRDPTPPEQDEHDLLTLYAGYAANAIERDRLLAQVTARNRVLETIREMLQTVAGPLEVSEGLPIALQALRRGLEADEVALFSPLRGESLPCRAYAAAPGEDRRLPSPPLRSAAAGVLASAPRDGVARPWQGDERLVAVAFDGPAGPSALIARWEEPRAQVEDRAVLEDAAHSLNLALEREEAVLAHQQTVALRRSRELQRDFLSRLSHELRTPLTAIRGYASSLMQTDVVWDDHSQNRFLECIALESARLGRLVDDLLDFSAIESGVLRLQSDWCQVRLVIEAAVSCLPGAWPDAVTIDCEEAAAPIWADHDRLEQVFVNLLTNALRHNPDGTRVMISVRELPAHGRLEVLVCDDGAGFPAELASSPFEPARRQRSASAGAGLGLSISRGIVEAHHGSIALVPSERGTTFRILLPTDELAARGEPAFVDLEDLHRLGDAGLQPLLEPAGDA